MCCKKEIAERTARDMQRSLESSGSSLIVYALQEEGERVSVSVDGQVKGIYIETSRRLQVVEDLHASTDLLDNFRADLESSTHPEAKQCVAFLLGMRIHNDSQPISDERLRTE